MIGAASLQAVGVIIPAEFTLNITPSSIMSVGGRGGNTSPTAYSQVINGVGPFTYLWTVTGSRLSVLAPESPSTAFSGGGVDELVAEVATLTVTDKGNSDAKISKSIDVTFNFHN
jgi:hypothetical protein